MAVAKLSLVRATANLLRKKRERRYIASMCGHTTKLVETLHAFEEKAVVELPQNNRQLPMFCGSCVSKRSIRCAWCSRPIFVGDPVTLHRAPDDFEVPIESRVFSHDPRRLVGCMHPDCIEISDPMSAFWRVGDDGTCIVAEIEETRAKFWFRHNMRRRPTYERPVQKRRK